MIPLSGGESDIDLLGPDPDTNSREDLCTTKPFSILVELLASPPIRNSINTNTSTTSSTTTHPLSCMITTTTYSAINTTISTLTLRHQPTLPHCLLPQHHYYQTHPTMHHLHQATLIRHPLTPTAKSKSTTCDIQSEHLQFTFHFIPSHPNYISKLKLPMHIAKLCCDIQHNAKSSIIQIIEKDLSKQNKHKKGNKKKAKQHQKPP